MYTFANSRLIILYKYVQACIYIQRYVNFLSCDVLTYKGYDMPKCFNIAENYPWKRDRLTQFLTDIAFNGPFTNACQDNITLCSAHIPIKAHTHYIYI